MKYINLEDELFNLAGSTFEEIENVEKLLGFKMPSALVEYLLLTGNKNTLYEWGCDYHGTNDLIRIRELIYEDIDWYKERGILVDIGNVIPFFQFQDTFLYLPVDLDNENPPVYALDIGDEPVIRKLNEKFSDYVQKRYEAIKLGS